MLFVKSTRDGYSGRVNQTQSTPDNITQLSEIIFQRIEKKGAISFCEFMDLALYQPRHGYYADPFQRQLGRKGDFFTSVSVGDTFGRLLSHQIQKVWKKDFDAADDFVVVEQGAHNGQLARDILTHLDEKIEYRIIEPNEKIRTQQGMMADQTGLGHRLNPVASVGDAQAKHGIFLCNELLDAFPVHLLVFQNSQWKERCVAAADGKFFWQDEPLPDELAPFTDEIGTVPDGYITEVCPAMRAWLCDCSELFSEQGRWWIIDYGHESPDYFSPLRKEGTLRCFHQHQAHDDPFSNIGETDITAHVNLTHLIQWAGEAGLRLEQLTDQHHFLTHAAKPWLLEVEKNAGDMDEETAQQIRQFQTLTHPSMMGQKFKVLEFSKGN